MDLSFLRRGFPWFGEYDPLAVVWAATGPADDDDDEEDGDSYSRGGTDDDDEDDEFYDDEEEEDDGHDAGGTLWAGAREMRQSS